MANGTHRARPTRGRLAGLGGLLALVMLMSGCGVGGRDVAPPVDAAQGRVVLRDVLDAWKGGKTSASLAEQTPPIRVADEDWVAGLKLVSYEVDPKDQLVGDVLRCPASLSLKEKSGKATKKRVYYNVTTAPTASVIRQD